MLLVYLNVLLVNQPFYFSLLIKYRMLTIAKTSLTALMWRKFISIWLPEHFP